jgi:hypothetical protein
LPGWRLTSSLTTDGICTPSVPIKMRSAPR